MKTLLLSFIIFFLPAAEKMNPSIEDVIVGLKAGDASQIASYFDNTIEITLPDKSNNFSKNQGKIVLQDFFTIHPVKSFQILHRGENSISQYCIGLVNTENGSYRTTVFLKLKGERHFLQEIRFENK